MNKDCIITIRDNDNFKPKSIDDMPMTVTRRSLRQFILEILKEKGLLEECEDEKI